MVKALATLKQRAMNILGLGMVKPTDQNWVSANLRTSELARGRFTPKDGAAYIAYLRGWVDMSAKKNATNCAMNELMHFRKGGKGPKIGKQRLRKLRTVKGLSDGSKDIVQVENSTALNMLDHPSSQESGEDFKLMRFYAKEACGNAFVYLSDSGEMMTLRPQFVAPIFQDSIKPIAGWVYGRGREREVALPFESVRQFKHFTNIDSPWLGDGPTKVCAEYADLLMFSTVAEAARWRNGNPPPYAVMLHESITDPTKRSQAIAEIERQLNGPENAGNRIVLAASDIKNLGFPPKDMEYVEGARECARLVLGAFDIPELLYFSTESGLATIEIALKHYYKTGIWPRLKRDAQQLTEMFQSIGLLGDNEFLAYENPSEEDNQAEATYWKTLVDSGMAVADTACADMGIPMLPDGLGEVPRYLGVVMTADAPIQVDPNKPDEGGQSPTKPDMALGDVPAITAPAQGEVKPNVDPTVDATAKETSLNGAQVTALAGLAAQVAADTLPLETAISISRAAFPAIDEVTMRGIFGPLKGFELPKVAPEPKPAEKSKKPKGTKDAGSTGAIEARFSAAVNGWLESIGQSVAAGVVEISATQQSQLAAIIERFTVEAWNAGGKAESGKLGVAFNIPSSQAIAAVQAPNSLIIEQITGTTQEYIRTAVSTGLESGQSYTQIATALQESGLSPERAAVIARTETANATSAGAMTFAVDEAGCDEKSWMLGGNPCEICIGIKAKVDARGGWIPMSEPFAAAGEFGNDRQIDRYPAHPNCTCDSNFRINPKGGVS